MQSCPNPSTILPSRIPKGTSIGEEKKKHRNHNQSQKSKKNLGPRDTLIGVKKIIKKKTRKLYLLLIIPLRLLLLNLIRFVGRKHPRGGVRLRSVFTISRNRSNGLGHRVIGTLFGFRRGHVHLAFQENPKLPPAFLVELASSTSGLVREMASGLVRIALETEKKTEKKSEKLLDENFWRTYCNGHKCGFAGRRECGAFEWKVLQAVAPVSMGAGVLPSTVSENKDELMFMRAKFERVVGSRDSEAFYMMNPDRNGGPELSIYLLRV